MTPPHLGTQEKWVNLLLKTILVFCTVHSNGPHVVYLCGWLRSLALPLTNSGTLEDANFSEPDLQAQNKW